MSKKLAYSGVLLGVHTILLVLINIIPMNTLFIMGIASLIISIIIMEFGPKSGVVFYLASIILSFLVINNKAQWVLYNLTFGVYGLIKYIIEQDRSIYLEYILKIIFANILLMITYFILRGFIYIPINILIIIAFQVVFMIYDSVYTKFIDYYETKIRKIINYI
ncbi:MAG: hypothetical protein IJH34_05105 [Romboutsia sp.]|nr:hypothetical protein [Romboutsia sp.]